jgi:hypothetical protein
LCPDLPSCVGFRGHTVQHTEFDAQEGPGTDWNDTDDCTC